MSEALNAITLANTLIVGGSSLVVYHGFVVTPQITPISFALRISSTFAVSIKNFMVISKEGIKTNVTLIFSANQALLAAKAGATYVSPFLGRLDDISMPGIDLIRDIVDIFNNYGIELLKNLFGTYYLPKTAS